MLNRFFLFDLIKSLLINYETTFSSGFILLGFVIILVNLVTDLARFPALEVLKSKS
jgi:hypothetical protein